MREFQKHKMGRNHTLRFSLFLFVALALFGITSLAVNAAWDMYGKFTEASDASTSAKRELTLLENRKQTVSVAIVSLASNRGVEAQMRERFGVALPGEGEIRVVREKTSDGSLVHKQEENVFLKLFHSLVAW